MHGLTPHKAFVITTTMLLLMMTSAAVQSAPPSNHDQLLGVPGGIVGLHAPGFLDPFNENCTLCHGEELKGAFAPSCFVCHGAFWDANQPQYPDSHSLLITGNRAHSAREAYCTFCHDMWGGEDNKLQYWHAPGHGTPLDNGCTLCHGTELAGTDGIAFSCYWCHDRLWAGEGPPNSHSVLLADFAYHQPGYEDPVAEGCTQCHGPNLDDGFAPSCFSCHGPGGSGLPSDHTELKGGFALHKPGYEDPFNNCTRCHGPNLDDGYATSCFACHVGGFPDQHHLLYGSVIPDPSVVPFPDANGDGIPDTSYSCVSCHDENLTVVRDCTACHGDPETGFLAGAALEPVPTPSCYNCHGEPSDRSGTAPPGGVRVSEAEDLDGVPTVYGASGEPLSLTAIVMTNVENDRLTYRWSFGDGTPLTSPSDDPTVTHTYDSSTGLVYQATLSVTDGVHRPNSYEFDVVLDAAPPGPRPDAWDVTTTEPSSFTITFRDYSGSLFGVTPEGGKAMGIESMGVIYWIDILMDPSGTSIWGTGNIYFGNINHEAGTMSGIVLGRQGGVFTFDGTKR